MAGAPEGNKNRARAKLWSAAIERAIAALPGAPDDTDTSDLVKGLNRAAHAFVVKMLADNDLGFYREFGDRIDGKPKQSVDMGLSDDEDNPIHALVAAADALKGKIRGQ